MNTLPNSLEVNETQDVTPTPGRLRIAIPTMTAKVYTRHRSGCPKGADKFFRHCSCPKWIYQHFDGEDRRFSAKTRVWNRAEKIRQQIEDAHDPVKMELKQLRENQQGKRITIPDAAQCYLADVLARNVTSLIVRYRRLLGKQLVPWSEENNLRYLDELTTPTLTRWRSTWPHHAPQTTHTYQSRLVSFFHFCVRQGWLERNPASLLSHIHFQSIPTDYFPRDEFEALVDATSLFEGESRKPKGWAVRLRTLLLTMRWSGLRLGDAVTLERCRLIGNNLLLFTAKTGAGVYIPLPPELVESLRAVPSGEIPNLRYFFWDGNNKKASVGKWGRALRQLFRVANIRKPDGTLKRCHCHMLRDTFAIEMLLAGVPIDQVSMLLGHSSITITLRHYSPWVRARQQQLEESVNRAHLIQGVTKSATKVVNLKRKGTGSPMTSTVLAANSPAQTAKRTAVHSGRDPKRSAAAKRAWVTIRAKRKMAQAA